MTLDADSILGGLRDMLSDVVIGHGNIEPELPGPTARGVLWQAAPGRFQLTAPSVARYRVEDGLRLTVEPLCDDSQRVVRFLRMTPLAALLHQRGRLVLHAAGAACEAGAVLIAGASAAGKSVLLAALLARGWRLLGDDLAVVDDTSSPRIHATFGELALWHGAAERLGYEPPNQGRCYLDHTDLLAGAPAPLRAVVMLGEAQSQAAPPERLAGAAALRHLSLAAYNNHVAEAVLGALPGMLLSARLADRVAVYRVQRQAGRWCADELADAVAGMVADG